MNCIIVDDDLNCIRALQGILNEFVPQVHVAGTAQNIKDAVKLINSTTIDVVFLDVEIQHETGFDLFRYFSDPGFEVIFTTAHEKYALRAIRSSCFDYLLKPIETSELVSAISRLEAASGKRTTTARAGVLINNLSKDKAIEKLAIPTKEGMVFIQTADIVFLEGDAKYTTLHLHNGLRYVSSKNIGEFEDLLNADQFFRCHRSWIVNLGKVEKFLKNDSQLQLQGGKLIDVSVRKKEEFLRLFHRM